MEPEIVVKEVRKPAQESCDDHYLRKVTQKEFDEAVDLHDMFINKFNQDAGKRMDFSNCDLANICMDGCDLRGAIFKCAYMEWVSAEETDFRYCDLNSVSLENSNLYRAQLDCAEMDGALLQNTNLRGAQIKGVTKGDGVDFTSANLYGAEIAHCNFTSAEFVYTNLEGAKIRNCDIADSYFDDNLDQGCDFTGTNLADAFDLSIETEETAEEEEEETEEEKENPHDQEPLV